jgi:hypothetical protein
MTLKVWCEECDGCGQIADCQRMGLDPYPACKGPDGSPRGYTLVEAVQLPEGRCVVLNGGKVYEAEAVGTLCIDIDESRQAVVSVEAAKLSRHLDDGDLVAIGLKEVGK